MRVLLVTSVVACVLALPRLHADTAQSSNATLTFEAASIKLNNSVGCGRDGTLAGGRFAMTCSTLRELITFAFPRDTGRLRFDAEIAGGPSWVNTDHFDLIAKIPEGEGLGIDAGNTGAGAVTSAQLSSIERVRMMARALLADRFKLAVHNERRDLPVYELRTDRSDGRPGVRMKKLDAACVPERGRPCGGFKMLGPGHIVGHGATMAVLILFLETPAGRPVFDRTGLQGAFDVDLQYAPPNDSSGVSVFTALREQLGLKLESTKAPVDVLVIDRAERPTPD